MRRAALVAAIVCAAPVARAEAPKEDYLDYARLFVGFGSVPFPDPAESVNMTTAFTLEIAHRPFDGALSTGFSISSVTDVNGSWNVITAGPFAKLDLMYVFTSGLWSHEPARHPPLRILVGARIGFAASQSFVHVTPTEDSRFQDATSYVLFRPELQPVLDFEVPFGLRHELALSLRGALDTSVALDTFRWSVALGFGYAWGGYEKPQK